MNGKRRLRPKGGLETTNGSSSEQSTSGKRRPEAKGGLETTNGSGSEQNTSGKGRPEPRGRLETPTRSENGGLEPTPEPEGSLETATTPKGGLETATTGCPEENGEAKGQKKPGPEDCAVIWLGEEEEEEEEADEGPGRYLAALEAVQLELEAVEEEAARAFRRLRAKFGLRRRPHLQRRNHLIQNIPGFWVTTFLNHPQLSAMISDRDEDALSYMTGLQVEEFGPTRPGCRIRFIFSVNPYFQNHVVAKEFVRGPSGHLVSHSTPIRWWQGQDPWCRPHKGRPAPRSFFAWFGDHSFPAGDRVAEVSPSTLPVCSQYDSSTASTPPSTSQYTFKHNPVLPVLSLPLPVPPSTSQCLPAPPSIPSITTPVLPVCSQHFSVLPRTSQYLPVPFGTGLRASPSTIPVLHNSFKAIPVFPVLFSLHPSTSSNSSQCSQYPPITSQYVPVLSNPSMGSFLYLTPALCNPQYPFEDILEPPVPLPVFPVPSQYIPVLSSPLSNP
uniref:Uncharacterized protein n=1 Tax=Cairina moschata TaxID=8855 RepID=A0A8C3CQL9_CAIMO